MAVIAGAGTGRDSDTVDIFAWDGSGRDDSVRFQKAMAGIGSRSLFVPARAAPYRINGILDVQHPNMTLKLAAGAVIECNVGKLGADFSQANFGSAFRIRGQSGFFLTGEGPSSIIRMARGSQGNAVTFIQSANGYVGDLTLESDWSKVEAMRDDSFCTGLMSIAYSPVSTQVSKIYASRIRVRGFLHYGMQAYGDRASFTAADCVLEDIGDPRQAESVGIGIGFTRGTQDCAMLGGSISRAKLHGLFQASAGLPARGVRCEGVSIADCGGWGVHMTEEAHWGVDPGHAGTRNFIVARNRIQRCGGGVRLGTYDAGAAIGGLTDGQVIDNVIADCRQSAILCQSVDVDGKRLERIDIASNAISGCGEGVYIGAECRDITVRPDNRFSRNGGKDIIDRQVRRSR